VRDDEDWREAMINHAKMTRVRGDKSSTKKLTAAWRDGASTNSKTYQ
jgi:hypothetical protein